jgi:hypothetical protein
MTGVLVAALLVVAAALPSAAEAQQFGALATGPDGAYGWVNNADSPREADRRALRECGRRCEIRVQFHNTCAAYATGINGASGWQRDDDVEYARRRAVGYCRENGGRDCRVRVWACAR